MARLLKDLSKSGVGITSKFIQHIFYSPAWQLAILYHLYLSEAVADAGGKVLFGIFNRRMGFRDNLYSYHVFDKSADGLGR